MYSEAEGSYAKEADPSFLVADDCFHSCSFSTVS